MTPEKNTTNYWMNRVATEKESETLTLAEIANIQKADDRLWAWSMLPLFLLGVAVWIWRNWEGGTAAIPVNIVLSIIWGGVVWACYKLGNR